MTRTIVLMTSLLLLACIGAFAAGTAEERAQTDSFELGAPGELPLVQDPVELRVMFAHRPIIEDLNTNLFSVYLRDQTGVHAVYESVNAADSASKLNLTLASGNYPDVMINFGIQPATQAVYGGEGVFLNLIDYLDQMPNVADMFMRRPVVRDAVTQLDGGIYAVPSVNEAYHVSYPQKMWIWPDWLEELDLEMPTTTEEFRDVLEAFVTQDPNRTGKADTIGLAGARSSWANPVAFLMSGFTYMRGYAVPGTLTVQDGQISSTAVTDEFQAGLEYIRGLIVDGLMTPEVFTMDTSQLRQLADNPVDILGAAASMHSGFSTWGIRGLRYVAVPPLEGPAGFVSTVHTQPVGMSHGKFAITSANRFPDLAARWVDVLYSHDFTLRSHYGPEKGMAWDEAEPGQLGATGEQADYVYIQENMYIEGKSTQNIGWVAEGATFLPAEFTNSFVANEINQHLTTETQEKYDGKGYPYEMPPLIFSDAQNAEMAELVTALDAYFQESVARFAVGELDVQDDFDNYVATMKRLGLDRLIRIYQEAYDRKYK